MIIYFPLSMFDHKPERWPFDHLLWPGIAQVSWQPCICAPARERAEWERLRVTCNTCHYQFLHTTFYQPTYDIKHYQPGPW